MCLTSAARQRFRLLSAVLFLGLFCNPSTGRQVDESPRQLYLLAATPTQHTDKTYPATLYRVTGDKKLKPVRELVAQADGVRFVQAWGNAILVAFPHLTTTTFSIVHTQGPMLPDNIVFNPHPYDLTTDPHGMIVAASLASAAEPPGSFARELVPLSPDFSDPAKGTLVSVSSGPAQAEPRITKNSWNDYAALRYEGIPGGPTGSPGLTGSALGDNFVISVSGHTIVIDTLPPSLRGIGKKIRAAIVVASERYLALTVERSQEEMSSASLPDSTEAFVHDRARDRWAAIRVEGSASAMRLCGPWLATIVGMWNPDHRPSPGRDSERSQETDRLPNVRDLYATFAGRWLWRPGILVLQNLADGRKIRIETGQEDSEVLWVGSDTVLYRVNDTIYQAKIVADHLQDTTLVVKDEDVPEIHWVFWSP
jgi:hypothetical protein